MHSPALDHFIAQSLERSRVLRDPADCVLALAPLMLDVIDAAGTFLEPQHYRSDPDHIHITGVPPARPRAVSLHLYGRTMNSFHMYDVDARTRKRIDVAHNHS